MVFPQGSAELIEAQKKQKKQRRPPIISSQPLNGFFAMTKDRSALQHYYAMHTMYVRMYSARLYPPHHLKFGGILQSAIATTNFPTSVSLEDL